MFKKEYEKRIKENYNKRFNKYKRFNREKFNKFKILFGTFNFGIVQDFYTFAYICLKNNIDLKDFIEYVNIIKNIIEETNTSAEKIEEKFRKKCDEDIENITSKCPKCNKKLKLSKINIPQGKRNIKGWKTHFMCENESCDYELFSKESLEEKLNINENGIDLSDIIDPDMDNLFGININDIKKSKENN